MFPAFSTILIKFLNNNLGFNLDLVLHIFGFTGVPILNEGVVENFGIIKSCINSESGFKGTYESLKLKKLLFLDNFGYLPDESDLLLDQRIHPFDSNSKYIVTFSNIIKNINLNIIKDEANFMAYINHETILGVFKSVIASQLLSFGQKIHILFLLEEIFKNQYLLENQLQLFAYLWSTNGMFEDIVFFYKQALFLIYNNHLLGKFDSTFIESLVEIQANHLISELRKLLNIIPISDVDSSNYLLFHSLQFYNEYVYELFDRISGDENFLIFCILKTGLHAYTPVQGIITDHDTLLLINCLNSIITSNPVDLELGRSLCGHLLENIEKLNLNEFEKSKTLFLNENKFNNIKFLDGPILDSHYLVDLLKNN